jgi:predicted dinucleotide-utilizing enzyme
LNALSFLFFKNRKCKLKSAWTLTDNLAKVQICAVSVPKVKRNTHEINVKWRYGEMQLKFANQTHPDNPDTNALAAWAAIRLLQTLLQ